MATTKTKILLCVTGASGLIYAKIFAKTFLRCHKTGELHIILSGDAVAVAVAEFGMNDFTIPELFDLTTPQIKRVFPYDNDDFSDSPASGSYRFDAVVVCPCSMNTLGNIAAGTTPTLIPRAASNALKERVPLVLVPRETPLSLIHLRNMTALAEAGAIILPAMPGFYHKPETIDDLAEHLVMKMFDVLKLPCDLQCRWIKDDNY